MAPAAEARPLRVMSINQCTDQLVLALLPRTRIVSVTSLSRDPRLSLLSDRAMRVAVNHGLAEEVVRDRPDLIVAGSFSTPATRAFLRRLGYPLLEVDEADDFAAIRRITRQVAAAVGEGPRGEVLIAHMDRTLAALAREPVPTTRVAAWDGAGFNARPGSLYAAILAAAGARNVAAEPRFAGAGAADAELLLAAAPDVIVQGTAREPSLRDAVIRSPVVRQYWRGRTVTMPAALTMCGTPFAADAAVALRRALQLATTRIPPAVRVERRPDTCAQAPRLCSGPAGVK